MSAYLVSADHLNALATFAKIHDTYINHWNVHLKGSTNTAEIADILRRANVDSLKARYGHGEDTEGYSFTEYRNKAALTPLAILKACICFDYQACEIPNYETTLAAQITASIVNSAVRELPGYDAQHWDFPDDLPPPLRILRTTTETADEVTQKLFADLTALQPKAKPTPTPTPAKAKPTPGKDEPF